MRSAIIVLSLLAGSAAFAQQPPPKKEVAPEYRALAEQRAMEKQKLSMCQAKADTARVVLRDRAKYVIECLEAK